MAIQMRDMEISEAMEIVLMLELLSSKIQNLAKELDATARLMNLKIYEVRVKRYVRKQETKIYSYWYASWRENYKVKNICLGNTKEVTYDEALLKAKKLKSEHLGISL